MKKLFVFTVLFLLYNSASAQKMTGAGKDLFQSTYITFSKKKPILLILNDGTKVQGTLKKLKRKGLIIQSVFLKEKSGKVSEFPASKIKEMYAYPHGFDKAMKTLDLVTNIYKIQRKDTQYGMLKDGAVLLRGLKISLRNKKAPKYYLIQLLNPEFDRYLEVYGDPHAHKTASVQFGMMTMAGGLEKSYYVKKGDKIYYIRKKDFKKDYVKLFGDCKEFIKKYPADKAKWRHFSEYVLEYTKIRSQKENTKEEDKRK